MGRKRKASAGEKQKARKAVTVKLLEREHAGKVTTPYRLMEEIVAAHHPRLGGAKIAIAWKFGKRADADGRIWLGSMKKGSDLDRTMHGFDGVLLLNHEVWNSGSQFSEAQMRALIDHNLCHLDVMNDSNGEPKLDEEGRKVYRIRKHDVEEFTEVVHRHGMWVDDLRLLAQHVMEHADKPLLPKSPPPKSIDEELNGKAPSNGHAAKNGRPKRVRLLKPVDGFEKDGLTVGTEIDVKGWRTGMPMVKSNGGAAVTLREDQYEAVGAA